jgi:hypothetical protein
MENPNISSIQIPTIQSIIEGKVVIVSGGGGGGGGGISLSKIYEASEDIQIGYAVATNIQGRIIKASSNDNKMCLGIATEQILTGYSGNIQYGGIISLNDWSLATGSVNLSINQNYYLGVDGLLTTTPPTAGYSQYLGKAISTNGLQLEINYFIKL